MHALLQHSWWTVVDFEAGKLDSCWRTLFGYMYADYFHRCIQICLGNVSYVLAAKRRHSDIHQMVLLVSSTRKLSIFFFFFFLPSVTNMIRALGFHCSLLCCLLTVSLCLRARVDEPCIQTFKVLFPTVIFVSLSMHVLLTCLFIACS